MFCDYDAFTEDEKEFDYIKGSGKGPEDWGDIHEEWQLCKNGEMQSPIDLMHERVQVVSHLGRLKRSYKPSNATLKNRGHDIMVCRDYLFIIVVLILLMPCTIF